ncbi:hypothetical protein EV178_000936 [Coemansia sp. RSA 1646]|nr:hypothetical protein EV178_000936 [Coemansia sp. RSA 1646]KAJ2092185.1 hypothetical protein IW138_001252 [Coemansia sp. RSA 986]
MARQEQAATGHKFQSFTSSFASASPFSQPPKTSSAGAAPPGVVSPGAPPHSATAASTNTSTSAATPSMPRGLTTGRLPSLASSTHSPPFNTTGGPRSHYPSTLGPQNHHYHQPPPSAFGAGRRGSGYLPPEKTAVGRSGVFDDVYGTGGAGDPFYRRHSLDMGISAQYSPPRAQYQRSPQQKHHQTQPLQQQQQQQQHSGSTGGSPHVLLSTPGRYTSRSGAASPHPLSFDQTASELSPVRTNTGSPNSPGGRGVKRPAPDSVFAGADNSGMADEDDDITDEDDDDDDSPGNGYRQPSNGDSSRQLLSTGRAGVPTADKPYACDQCELTFSRQHNLKSHALTHSTERPFSCNVCQTPFRRQHDLKRHMKLHTGEKPYKCTNCERSFARLDALNRHMRAENFHACNQAAKKARTSVMVLDRASRLKSGSSASASVAYLEQRRASTTTTAAHHQYPPPGSSPSVAGGGMASVSGVGAGAQASNWSHWTHRPSIAADEAMLRRMHERFGAPPSYAPVQAPAPPALAQPQPQPQSQKPYYTPPTASHKQQSSAAAAHHATASAPYGSSDPRAYGPSQQPPPQHYASNIHQQPPASTPSMTSPGSGGSSTFTTSQQQHQNQTGSRYRSDDGGSAAAHSGAAPLSAISYPVSKTGAGAGAGAGAHPPPTLPEESSSLGIDNSADGNNSTMSSSHALPHQQYRPYQNQQLAASHPVHPPPPLSVHHQSHPPPLQHAQMRLPPIELVPPRRHSLAVTSHLERYRARGGNGTTPPPPSQAQAHSIENNASSKDDQQRKDADNSSAGGDNNNNGSSKLPPPPLHHQQMQKRVYPADNESPFGRRPPAQKPPASFLNYTPSVVAHHQQQRQHQSASSATTTGGGAPPLLSTANGVAAMDSGIDAKSADSHVLLTSRQPGYYYPGQQQHSAPLLATTTGSSKAALESSGLATAGEAANAMANSAAVAGSRRESAYSATTSVPSIERIADTRRSSIIALTNPQSEDDLRTENADLKRRIDEMEAKYLKEVDRLNQVVRELEIEKSLLKSLLIEKSDGGATGDAPSSLSKKVFSSVSSPVSPKRGGSITAPTSSYGEGGSSIKRQQSLSELPLAESIVARSATGEER